MGLAQRFTLCCAVLALVCGSFGMITKRCAPNGCCKFKQGKSRAMECNLKDWKKEFAIPKHKTSSAYEIMHFSHGSHNVTVNHNALDHLETVLLTDLKNLTFLGSSKTQARRTGGATTVPSGNLAINRVRNLQLGPNSFDGWQSKDSIVSIKNIENCHIDRSAFAPSTTIKRLLLENITSLVLAEDAFQATVVEMLLRNVTIMDCPHGAFGGRVDRLLMDSVTVNAMKSGCVRPQDAWQNLTLSHSHLGQVSRSAITGSIEDVKVTECNISTVDSGGIQVNVSRFTLSATNISELMPDAMEVQADRTISLQGLSVSRLQRNAFRGLRVVVTPNRGINITDLSITQADNGSLMFADGADLHVRELVFDIVKKCNMSEDAYTHSVYVESAWQPANSAISPRLYTTFQPLFACDFEAEIANFYAHQERMQNSSQEGAQ